MSPIQQQTARLEIRNARPTDAKTIADFHVRIWRETYRDVAPQEAIRVLDENRREQSWKKALSDATSNQQTCLAIADGSLVGFITFGSARDAVFSPNAEIKHLYVDGSWRGRGIGQELMTIAFQKLKEQGFPGVGLAVVQDNQQARAFYKKFGGIETGCFTDPGPIWKSQNVLVTWTF